jgi:hypothetical protein
VGCFGCGGGFFRSRVNVSRELDPKAQTAGWILFGGPWTAVAGPHIWLVAPLNGVTLYLVVLLGFAGYSYSVLARLNHTYGVADVGMNGLSMSSLNYYRVMSKKETFPEFHTERPDPPVGKSIYVLSELNTRGFMDKDNLVVIYRGKFPDLVIAVRPDGPIPAVMIER